MDQGHEIGRRGAASLGLAGAAALLAGTATAQGAGQGAGQGVVPAPATPGRGDLSQQPPVVVEVELGSADGVHVFTPQRLRFEAGKLYRLVLRNRSPQPHYFTSDAFAAAIWTRKAQVMGQGADGRDLVVAEFKGALREIEVHPGFSAEWWFVPVQAGRFTDLRCGIKEADGSTHAEHGMRGEIVVE